MNVHDYEYIVEIALYGSIHRAADRIGVTAGALSKALSRIEKELDLRLFERNGNRISLTNAGKRYVEVGRQITLLDRELMRDMESIHTSGDVVIRVGIPRAMTSFVLEKVFPRFLEENPEKKLFLERGGSEDMIKMLEDGKLDIALAFSEEFKVKLDYRHLAAIPAVLAVPMGSDLIQKSVIEKGSPFRVIESDDWLDEPFIRTTSISIQSQLANIYFTKKNRAPPTRLCVGDSVTALTAVENGLGNAIVLASPGQEGFVNYLKVKDMELTMDFYSVTKKHEYLSTGMQSFLDIAEKAYHAH